MKNKKLFYLFLSISILILILIIYFSLSNGKKSTAQSDTFTDVVVSILPDKEVITNKDLRPFYESNEFKIFIRKAFGHFGLFFGFSLFVNLTFLQTKLKLHICSISTLTIGLFVASLSELLQYFTSGRSAALKDICIDFGGYVCCFIMFVIILILIYKHRLKLKENKNA